MRQKPLLFYAVCTKGFTLATLAIFARPGRVEVVSCSIDQCEVVGQNTRLEVAFAIGLHTYARTREVCRADICHFARTPQFRGRCVADTLLGFRVLIVLSLLHCQSRFFADTLLVILQTSWEVSGVER